MTQVNITVDTNYVDPYTLELFTNHKLDNASRWINTSDIGEASAMVIADPVNYENVFKALVEDAEEFIETINAEFTGISIDYAPQAYAHQYIRNLQQ